MYILTAIVYLLVFLALIYIAGLCLVWTYEMRLSKSFRMMRKQMKVLSGLPCSMAVMHAKMFRLQQDYRQYSGELECKQQFILKNVLLIRKSTLKTKYGEY